MKIVSCNLNGIRASHKKGLLDWILKNDADIICFQEIKAQESQFPEEILNIKKYYLYTNSADKKGYSGTAILTKEKPLKSSSFLTGNFDSEGRSIKLEYKNFILINIYVPHGGRKKEKLNYKLKCFNEINNKIKKNRK